MELQEILNKLKNHEDRIKALEVSQTSVNVDIAKQEKQYGGPKGGVLLLLKRGAFKTKSTAAVIKNKLEEEGYVYKIQVIQTALNRLSNPKGPLVKIDEGGKKVYVERK